MAVESTSSCSSTSHAPAVQESYIDYLGRKVIRISQTEELVESLQVMPTSLNNICHIRGGYQGKIHPVINDEDLPSGHWLCLAESINQIARDRLGIVSDLPTEVDPKGRWFKRVNVGLKCESPQWRCLASSLGARQITEQMKEDVAQLFYLEHLYQLNLLGPEDDAELQVFAQYVFEKIGNRIVVALPLANLSFLDRAEVQGLDSIPEFALAEDAVLPVRRNRHTRLLEIYSKHYPKELFSKVPTALIKARIERNKLENTYSNLSGLMSNIEVHLREPHSGSSEKFYLLCEQLYRKHFTFTADPIENEIEEIKKQLIHLLRKYHKFTVKQGLEKIKALLRTHLDKTFPKPFGPDEASAGEYFCDLAYKDIFELDFFFEYLFLANQRTLRHHRNRNLDDLLGSNLIVASTKK